MNSEGLSMVEATSVINEEDNDEELEEEEYSLSSNSDYWSELEAIPRIYPYSTLR